MAERAARTRRKPSGGKRREPLGARRRNCQIVSFTPRVTKHGLSGSPAVRHFFWSEPVLRPWFSRITRHETRITAFLSCVLKRKVVEAAGVEPASGIVLHGEPTYLVRSKVSTGSSERTRLNPSSPIVCQPCAPDRSLGPIPPDDAPRPHAGLWTRAAAGSGSVCERRIVGSCCFSDRFTGARNPICLSTTDAIPSNPLRPHTRIRGEENVLFCLHCNVAVERGLACISHHSSRRSA